MDLISLIESNLLSCSWKELGLECMGCGFQRSVIHLLKGEFALAFKLYPAIYTLILMFGFLGLHLRFNFAKGHRILMGLFIVNLLIILVGYTIKFIN